MISALLFMACLSYFIPLNFVQVWDLLKWFSELGGSRGEGRLNLKPASTDHRVINKPENSHRHTTTTTRVGLIVANKQCNNTASISILTNPPGQAIQVGCYETMTIWCHDTTRPRHVNKLDYVLLMSPADARHVTTPSRELF